MTTKIAISLPDDQVAALKRAVAEGRAPSVSAMVSQSLAARFTADTYDAFLADLVAAAQPSEKDYDWADNELDKL